MRARILFAVFAFAAPLAAQGAPQPTNPAADREAVRRAALDYVEGFYEGDSAKFLRGVRRDFHKYGFWWARDSSRYLGEGMPLDEALTYIRRVKQNNRQAPPTAIKQIDLLDVLDQTANVKLTAFWGIDYLLLGKYDGKWMISHVLWQSPPPKATSP
jgi:hypothetical protein